MGCANRVCVAAILIWAAATPFCAAGAAGAKAKPHFPTAGELLDKFGQTQDKLQSFIIKAEDSSETRSSYFRSEKEKKKTHSSSEVRFDGRRISYREYSWGDFGPGSDLVRKNNPRYRSTTWDGNDCFLYKQSPTSTARPRPVVEIYHSRKFAETLFKKRGYDGSCLSGYFEDERVDSVLRQADTISVRDKMEQAGKAGSQCYVIDAVTKYGEYTVWIDPEHGYNISKARVKRKAGDIWRGQPLKGKGECWYFLDKVYFEKIDNVWVSMQADVRGGRIYADGNFHETVSHYKRTEVILNPDHDVLRSFATDDIPDGSQLTGYVDLNKGFFNSGDPQYYWQRDAKVVVDRQGRLVKYELGKGLHPVVKAVPDLRQLWLKIPADQTRGKKILLCFCDLTQPASQKYVLEFNRLSASLAENDVLIAALHCSKANPDVSDAWVRANNIRLAIGKLRDVVVPELLRAWRAEKLPWLVLSDTEHTITAEGFDLSELDEKLKRSGHAER